MLVRRWGTHHCLWIVPLLALVLGKMVLKSVLKTMLLSRLVAQVNDLHVSMGDLVVFDVAEVASDVEFLCEGLADILVDVVHSSGPHMVLPLFKPSGVNTKLTYTGAEK